MTTTIYDTLRRLAQWTAPPEALALSLYLDLSPAQKEPGPDRARAAWDEVHESLGDGAGALGELVEAWLHRLPRIVARARSRGCDGLAAFLCAEPRLEEHVTLRFALEDQVSVGSHLSLAQLLTCAEEYERTACVVLGRDGRARVLDLHVGDVARSWDVAPSAVRDLAGELDVLLLPMVREDPGLHLLLLGEPAATGALEGALSEEARARILERIDWEERPGSEERDLLVAAHRALQRYERRAEAEGVTRLLELKEEGEPAAVGLDETLEAVNAGRARVLYVLQGFHRQGWLCDACDHLGLLPCPPACVACGATVSEVDLGDHLIGRAAARGAEIETVCRSEALLSAGSVGALVDQTP